MPQSVPAQQADAAKYADSTILIVEDDPVIRRFMRIILKRAGFKLIEARSGEEAIQMTDGVENTIDLIITDGVMPGMNGLQLARHYLERIPEIKAILVSGYLEHFLSQPDLPANIEAFFRKPFTQQELLEKVGELLFIRD